MKNKKPTEHDLLLANVREMLKSRAGRTVLWHILGLSGLYIDTTETYAAGKRAIGLMLLRLIEEADSTAYPRMILEFNSSKE